MIVMKHSRWVDGEFVGVGGYGQSDSGKSTSPRLHHPQDLVAQPMS